MQYNSGVNVSGNIMSLVYGSDYARNEYTLDEMAFCYIFKGVPVLDASGLVLPATTLARFCYTRMFSGCTSLTTTPDLPATTLAESCYSSMFNGCTSLITAPELPATILASGCYGSMFEGCTSLTSALQLFLRRHWQALAIDTCSKVVRL